MPPTLQQATTNACLCQRLPDTNRQVSCGVTVPFSWVLVHKVLLCPPRVYLPVLCKFWQLYRGVNGDLLQEDTWHTHTRAPVPAADHCQPVSPQEMLKHSSLSVSVGSLGPGIQSFFEPSESLWWEQGFILNANSPLLLSCWGFSFALGCGVAPHSHSRNWIKQEIARVNVDILEISELKWTGIGEFNSDDHYIY